MANTSPATAERFTKIRLYFLIILHFIPLKYKYGSQTHQGNKLTQKNGNAFQGCTCHEIAPSLHFPQVSRVSLAQIDCPPPLHCSPIRGLLYGNEWKVGNIFLQLQQLESLLIKRQKPSRRGRSLIFNCLLYYHSSRAQHAQPLRGRMFYSLLDVAVYTGSSWCFSNVSPLDLPISTPIGCET